VGIYTPVIVTTAKLFISDSDYGQIDLETGEVPSATLREVPLVRFSKTFASGKAHADATASSLEGAAKEAERSVIVVRAGNFMQMLKEFEVNNSGTLLQTLWGAATSGS
jgi:hypothetical protein